MIRYVQDTTARGMVWHTILTVDVNMCEKQARARISNVDTGADLYATGAQLRAMYHPFWLRVFRLLNPHFLFHKVVSVPVCVLPIRLQVQRILLYQSVTNMCVFFHTHIHFCDNYAMELVTDS